VGLELAKAWVRVAVDNSGLAAGLEETRQAVEGSLRSITPLVGTVLAGLGLNNLLSDARAMMGEAQARTQAERRLESAWIATGNAIGMSLKELHAWGEEWERVTSFDGTQIIDVMSSLLTYTALTRSEMQKVMDTAMDITAQYGGDLKMNVQQIAKMLSNPLDKNVGLGKLGQQGYYITPEQRTKMKSYQESGNEEGARGVLMEVLSGQEGAARRIAGPYTELKRLKNELKEIRITVGRQVSDVWKKWEEATIALSFAKARLVSWIMWLADALLTVNYALGDGLILSLAAGAAGAVALANALMGVWKSLLMISTLVKVNPWMLALGLLVGGGIWLMGYLSKGQADAKKKDKPDDKKAEGASVKEKPKFEIRREGFLEFGKTVQASFLKDADKDIPRRQLDALHENTTAVAKVETAVRELRIPQQGLA
jgi:hypothetical protein